MTALKWLTQGYGYEITSADVWAAFTHTMQAAKNADVSEQTLGRITDLVMQEPSADRFVARILGRRLGVGRDDAP